MEAKIDRRSQRPCLSIDVYNDGTIEVKIFALTDLEQEDGQKIFDKIKDLIGEMQNRLAGDRICMATTIDPGRPSTRWGTRWTDGMTRAAAELSACAFDDSKS